MAYKCNRCGSGSGNLMLVSATTGKCVNCGHVASLRRTAGNDAGFARAHAKQLGVTINQTKGNHPEGRN